MIFNQLYITLKKRENKFFSFRGKVIINKEYEL